MNSNEILIVEDESRLAKVLAEYLGQAGFETHTLAEGSGVVDRVRAQPPCLVLLDLNLPGRDGLDVCRDLRSFSTVPIIMLTARAEEIDRLLGLELGADDYMCKPYSPREVVARVRAVLRRAHTGNEASHGGESPDVPLSLDESSMRVRAHGAEVELTRVEFHLLLTMYRHPGRIYSREQLMDNIYVDGRIVSDRTIDSHVKKLRRKLAQLVPGAELVHSVYGVGYRYEAPGRDDEPPGKGA